MGSLPSTLEGRRRAARAQYWFVIFRHFRPGVDPSHNTKLGSETVVTMGKPTMEDPEPGNLSTKGHGVEDFDDILDDLGGLGKYQKRLLFFLLGPLFFIMPFPLLHQVLVLHAPKHDCVPSPSDVLSQEQL